MLRIAWEGACCPLTLQAAQLANNRLNLRRPEGTKRRHSGSRYTILDNSDQSIV